MALGSHAASAPRPGVVRIGARLFPWATRGPGGGRGQRPALLLAFADGTARSPMVMRPVGTRHSMDGGPDRDPRETRRGTSPCLQSPGAARGRSLARARRVNAACERYEAAWRQDGGPASRTNWPGDRNATRPSCWPSCSRSRWSCVGGRASARRPRIISPGSRARRRRSRRPSAPGRGTRRAPRLDPIPPPPRRRGRRRDRGRGGDVAARVGPPRPGLRRLRAAGGDRPGRHGRRLQGPPAEPQPHRRPQDDPGRAARLAGRDGSGSASRPRRRPTSTTRTSCRSTRSASERRPLLHHEAGSTAAAWRGTSPAWSTTRRRPRGCWRRWPARSTTPTSAASCTAT